MAIGLIIPCFLFLSRVCVPISDGKAVEKRWGMEVGAGRVRLESGCVGGMGNFIGGAGVEESRKLVSTKSSRFLI